MDNIIESFKNSWLDFFNDKLIGKIPEFVFALIILIIGVKLSGVLKNVVQRILNKYMKNQNSMINFLVYIAHVAFLIAVLLICLTMIGVKTTSIVTIIGAAGLSVGLALKEIFSDIGAALVILFFKPFNIGDYIVVPDEGIEGTVNDVQLCFTYLKTNDNRVVICPNSILVNNDLTNVTYQDFRRMDFSFKVAFDTDMYLMKKIVENIISSEARFEKIPEPIIGIESIDNGVYDFVAKPWIRTDIYWDVYYDVMESFKKEFDKNNIEFPIYRYKEN